MEKFPWSTDIKQTSWNQIKVIAQSIFKLRFHKKQDWNALFVFHVAQYHDNLSFHQFEIFG